MSEVAALDFSEHGADVDFGKQTFAFLEKAVARGMKEEDYSLLYRDYDEIRKVRPRRRVQR